jgi:hypothetical protein
MRISWHKWWLVALASTACSLNPQPDLPLDTRSSGGASGGTDIVVSPGGPQTGAGNSNGVTTGGASAGGANGAAPDAGAADSTDGSVPGQGGAGDASAGESGNGTAGAAGDVPVVVRQQPVVR